MDRSGIFYLVGFGEGGWGAALLKATLTTFALSVAGFLCGAALGALAAFARLSGGLRLVYTVEVDDNHGGSATQAVTVTITGSNENPVITASTDGAVTEDTVTTNLTTAGTVSFTDVDLTDTHLVSATPVGGGYVGTFTPTVSHDTTGGGAGVVSWSFVVPDSALQNLGANQTVVQAWDED